MPSTDGTFSQLGEVWEPSDRSLLNKFAEPEIKWEEHRWVCGGIVDTRAYTSKPVATGRIREVAVQGQAARTWLRQGAVPPVVARCRRAWEALALAVLEREAKRLRDIDRSLCAWAFLGFVKALEMALLGGGESSNEEEEALSTKEQERLLLVREQQMLQVSLSSCIGSYTHYSEIQAFAKEHESCGVHAIKTAARETVPAISVPPPRKRAAAAAQTRRGRRCAA